MNKFHALKKYEKYILANANVANTFPMKSLAAFQVRSLGTFPLFAKRTMTAAVTLVTASGGLGKAFSSERFT